MENASKALIIAGAILLTMLIIALGVAIYNNAIKNADIHNIDQQEILMFNSTFENYSGNQLGSQVKSLIGRLISNAGINGEDPIKLPSVKCENFPANATVTNVDGEATASKDISKYNGANGLGGIRNELISTHTYNITLEYSSVGLVSKIIIDYNT